MRRFDVIDISGDAGIRVYGDTIEGLFVAAAEGMYSLVTDLDDVRLVREVLFHVKSHSLEGLLVSWLNELIFYFDTYGFIGKEIVITEIIPSVTVPPQEGGLEEGEYALKGTVYGEDFDPERHDRRLLIKAATYHQLRISKEDGLWSANIIFDI